MLIDYFLQAQQTCFGFGLTGVHDCGVSEHTIDLVDAEQKAGRLLHVCSHILRHVQGRCNTSCINHHLRISVPHHRIHSCQFHFGKRIRRYQILFSETEKGVTGNLFAPWGPKIGMKLLHFE